MLFKHLAPQSCLVSIKHPMIVKDQEKIFTKNTVDLLSYNQIRDMHEIFTCVFPYIFNVGLEISYCKKSCIMYMFQ